MTSEELASKEVSQWRSSEGEKSKKRVVLDAAAAAKFSSAANLTLAREERDTKRAVRCCTPKHLAIGWHL
jgi:hypothetical protein